MYKISFLGLLGIPYGVFIGIIALAGLKYLGYLPNSMREGDLYVVITIAGSAGGIVGAIVGAAGAIVSAHAKEDQPPATVGSWFEFLLGNFLLLGLLAVIARRLINL